MTSELMEAWQSAEPGLDHLARVKMARPTPAPEEIVVRVETSALNFSDLLMIDDRYQVRPPRPFIPGQEVAGTVALAGERSGFRVGDRVASKVNWGGFAEYVAVRGDMAISVPNDASAAAACALPVVYTTAMVALTESTTVSADETVLVLAAAGGVGLAAVEIARHLGARVIAVAGGQEKCALAKTFGANEAVDYHKDKWGEEVKQLTGGSGIDVIVDPVGGSAAKEAMRLIAWQGRYLIVGFTSGEIPAIPANRLLLKRAAAIGVYWNHDRDAVMIRRVSERLSDWLKSGTIRPHIGSTFPFDQLPTALRALNDRKTTGKVILSLNQ